MYIAMYLCTYVHCDYLISTVRQYDTINYGVGLMIISDWWLRTRSKFNLQGKFKDIHGNIGSLETPQQVQIHPSI